MTITFAKPPINEVVIGIAFLPRQDFLVPHFGQFWAQIRGQYPKVAHAAPIFTAGSQLVQDAVSGTWLPRVWLVSDDDSRLVQLQQDQLYVNWRQTEEAKPYPRFPVIRDEFNRVWDLFCKFLQKEMGAGPQPVRLEVSYINVIPQGEGWASVVDFGGVLRDFKWHPGQRYLPAPLRYAANFEFEMDKGITLAAKTAMGRRLPDNNEVLRLELVAKSVISGEFDMSSLVERAHDIIVNAFKDLTTDAMHRDPWQLQEQ
jgi:hypothetical protein